MVNLGSGLVGARCQEWATKRACSCQGERGEFPVTQRQIATSLFTAALAISDSEYFLHTARCSCSLIIGYTLKYAFDASLNVSMFRFWFSHAIMKERYYYYYCCSLGESIKNKTPG